MSQTARLHDYIGKTDAAVLAFCQNFGSIVSLTPVSFAMTVQECQDYQAMVSDFQAKLQAATEPTTRGHFTIFEKNRVKKELVALTRKYAMQINRLTTVTDTQRTQLGLTIPNSERHPLPAPSTSPLIQFLKVNGYQVTLRLRDSERPDSKARPHGTIGACILSYVGDAPPVNVQDWKLEGNATRPSDVTVTFGESVAAGSKVWFTAFWYNTRGSGPAATPVWTNIQFGGLDKGNIFSAEGKTRKAA